MSKSVHIQSETQQSPIFSQQGFSVLRGRNFFSHYAPGTAQYGSMFDWITTLSASNNQPGDSIKGRKFSGNQKTTKRQNAPLDDRALCTASKRAVAGANERRRENAGSIAFILNKEPEHRAISH